MSEGRQDHGAAPRPVAEIVRELRYAEQVEDEAAVAQLRQELRSYADGAGGQEVATRAG